MTTTKKAVLVTTAHRGVFFGLLKEQEGNVVTLAWARNCAYWSADLRGFLGLAERGPSSTCKVGPAVKTLTLYDVTSISEVTEPAQAAWKGATWNG